MELPLFAPGSTMIAEDRWHDELWAAVPQRVVDSTADQLVTYVPTGAVATRASNRDLPGTETLTRDQRKMLALRTGVARVAEVPEAPDKLFLYRSDRWSRINLGWRSTTGEFLGWYVNFEFPAERTLTGIRTMDLVLDLWVNPDRSWQWKDRSDYLRAVDDHLLDAAVRPHLDDEAALVLDELNTASGPFAEEWTRFRPGPDWAVPVLTDGHAWGGSLWDLPEGRRVMRT
ncbi:DUF402 domain-containing protein [Microlunatus elymi]|uniref:DUF402 domain-containing protein n=1 Tax=Microlunatus elymi TaxID=2596828 RepID=A0A516Q0U9_9ACTN|nr:DUF402 domain-containing protein [Microlunatus elymi]QDP97028.1 DUF402 domain-containing protein [Microlunatus elymi]